MSKRQIRRTVLKSVQPRSQTPEWIGCLMIVFLIILIFLVMKGP